MYITGNNPTCVTGSVQAMQENAILTVTATHTLIVDFTINLLMKFL